MARRYRITRGGSWSTEQLLEAGGYGYGHSCAPSAKVPARGSAARPAEVVLIGFDHTVATPSLSAR